MQTWLVGNVHLVAGNESSIPEICALLERTGIKVQANPDVYVRAYDRFGIAEARSLRERASLRPVGDAPSSPRLRRAQRVFVIVTPGMTSEAQNALLKTLEEPPADALFFFVVPAPETLLPTLRSRAQTLALNSLSEEESSIDAKTFLAASPQKRLDMLKPLLEKDEDEKRDMGAVINFLSSLEALLGKTPEGLHAIYRARKYIGAKGALVKPLLEQVALLVRVLK